MTDKQDLSSLDRPEILEVLFPLAYSPSYLAENQPLPSGEGQSCVIEVEQGIKIECGFWVTDKAAPTMLYFHGNGETAAGGAWLAPLFHQRGINLFMTDYRGYGSSGGKPTISNMMSDAHAILSGFREIIGKDGYNDSLFLMGRSLGSVPAVELALNRQDDIKGVIIESGTANNFRLLWSSLGIVGGEFLLDEDSPFLNKVKVRDIHAPTLIIHGEIDELIPVGEGKELYSNSASRDKRILLIPGAGHNDIMVVELDLYFDTVAGFVRTNS
ncbi:MAG: alpha/beta hydrolase [Dehalococcoidales bacterium]|nr:alpha/beta hydrolase [Dehalococcoidales bacterium]